MSATQTKHTNYTDEQTEQLRHLLIDENKPIEEIATILGKTVRSVIAKASKEKIYQTPTKSGHKREMLKAEMVTRIAKYLDKNEEQLESLEKATAVALLAVLHGLEGVSEVEGLTAQ